MACARRVITSPMMTWSSWRRKPACCRSNLSASKIKGRLQPGKMFLVDLEQGRIIADEELKKKYASAQPYGKWLEENHVLLKNLPEPPHTHELDHDSILQRQQAFGYTFEDLRFIVGPMARDGVQPLGSMGTDTPLAVLSEKPQLLYNYFKQLFAQVTNPPIDPIREEIITSTEIMVGGEGNLLEPTPESSRLIKMHYPILTNEELEKLRHINRPGFKTVTLPILFKAADGPNGLAGALDIIFAAADKAIADGANIIVLSDRGVGPIVGTDSRVARGFRTASSFDPQRHAHKDRIDPRIRRTARGSSFLHAHRLRLHGHQSVSCV